MDFENSAEAAGSINDWVSAQTNNRIKNTIAPYKQCNFCCFRKIIYFKASWLNSFESNDKQNF